MNYKTHIVGGLISGSIVGMHPSVPKAITPILVLAGGFGGLIPDIDHTGSYIGRRMKVTSAIVSKLLGHRGATHVPFFMGMVTFVLYCTLGRLIKNIINPEWIFISMYAGIISHIILDMFNKMGVPLFHPFSGKYISLGTIKVNSNKETIVRIFLYLLLVRVQVQLIMGI